MPDGPFTRARTSRRRFAPRAATRASLAALALAGALAAACASSQPAAEAGAPRRPADATLKVVNRTSADVRIEVDGRPLGEVPAGREQYFVGLAPGTLSLRGASLDDALEFRRDLLTLESGETFTWVLREGEETAGGRTGGPRETASIVVENGTDWDVEVLLDGAVLGSAAPGRSTRFDGVEPGAHRLEARAPESPFPQEFPVLERGETFTWRLRGPGPVAAEGVLPAPGTGRLRVENPNREPVTVRLNGIALGRVEASETRIFDHLASGSIELSAESLDGLTRYVGPEVRIEPGGVTLWRLGPGSPAELAGAAAPEVTVRPGPGEEPVNDRPTGPEAAVEPARAETGPEPRAVPGLEEEEGIELPGGTGGKSFVVENHTTQDLEILIDGESVGAVGAGMSRSFTELPGPRFTPSAVSASGARRFEHPQVDLTAQDSFSWIILP